MRPPAEIAVFPNGSPSDSEVAQALQCQDCDSTIVRREISPGVDEVLVAHDDTCPFYLGITKR